ncbi:MAG: OmpH family outer membrane protein [Alphaproteobacteria bacterium]|nr:OmpH family outer membrane protein [Alphaproteobacteria bacterium]
MIAVLLALPAYGAAPSSAADAPAQIIGVIDLRGVVMESSAGASVMKQRESLRSALKASVAKEEKALRDSEQELSRSRTLITAEAFAEKQKALGARVVEAQRSVEVRRRGIDMTAGEGLDKLEKKVLEVAATIARDRGMNIVLHSSQTVFFDGKFDIGKATIEQVNKDMPSLALRDPAVLIAEARAKQKPSSPEAGGR